VVLKLIRAPDWDGAKEYETSERRYSVVLYAKLTLENQPRSLLARVCNISEGGLMATVLEAREVDGNLSVAISGCEVLRGQIVWGNGIKVGVQFSESIDPLEFLSSRNDRSEAGCGVSQYHSEITQYRKMDRYQFQDDCIGDCRETLEELNLFHNSNYIQNEIIVM
jgi:hypothetical protein